MGQAGLELLDNQDLGTACDGILKEPLTTGRLSCQRDKQVPGLHRARVLANFGDLKRGQDLITSAIGQLETVDEQVAFEITQELR